MLFVFSCSSQRFADGKQRESHVKTKKIKVPSIDLVAALKAMYNENQYNVPQVCFMMFFIECWPLNVFVAQGGGRKRI